MTKGETMLWLAGWRPVSEEWPRPEWIEPETGTRYGKREAIIIQSKRGAGAIPEGQERGKE